MQSSTTQHVYWLVSSVLLSLGALLTCKAFDKILKNPSPLHSAFAAQLLVHSITIVNFLPAHITSFFSGQVQGEWWCKISGMMSIVEVFTMISNTMVVGFVVRNQFHHSRANPSHTIYKGLLTGWTLGWMSAFLYLIGGVIGPFHGLYCCLNDVGNPLVLIPYLIFVLGTLLRLLFSFYDAYGVMEDMKVSLGAATDAMIQKHNLHMERFLRFGMMIVLSFYSFWAMGSILAVLESFNIDYPLELDVVAGCLYKIHILIDAYIVYLY